MPAWSSSRARREASSAAAIPVACTRGTIAASFARMSQLRADPAGGLLERSDELAMLAECVAAVEESGRGQVLLLGGEAGVGKTTLLQAFCDEQPARVWWGACEPLFTPRPLGPLPRSPRMSAASSRRSSTPARCRTRS